MIESIDQFNQSEEEEEVLTNNAPDERNSRLFLRDHMRVFGATLGPSTHCHHELNIGVSLAKSREVAETTLVYVQLQKEEVFIYSLVGIIKC